jgi:hypothetical protein
MVRVPTILSPVHPGGSIKNSMSGACNRWNVIPHFHQAQLDQSAQMIWIDRKHGPLGLDIPERPAKVDSSNGIDAGKIVHTEKPPLWYKQRKAFVFRKSLAARPTPFGL